jgi:hypothetical protein
MQLGRRLGLLGDPCYGEHAKAGERVMSRTVTLRQPITSGRKVEGAMARALEAALA